MAFQGYLLLGLLLLLLGTNSIAVTPSLHTAFTEPEQFSSGFHFRDVIGVLPGAANEGGRDQAFGILTPIDIQEDVGIMKDMNLDAYRRKAKWGCEQGGNQYYNNLINELLAKGITPFVTIFHWDLPQTLEDEYGGFLSPHIVYGGYATGTAPGRCSSWQNLNCTGGDSATEPYIVSHYQILAHAAAVELYKQKYQAAQKGVIGISLVSHWMVPYSNAKHNRNAALRSLDFMLGWFLDPLTFGDYPHSMRSLVGKRLPKFTKEESKMVKGSFDFIGLNYYTALYAAYAPHINSGNKSYLTDALVNETNWEAWCLIGPQAASSWLHVYPRGIRDLLLYTKEKYHNPNLHYRECRDGVNVKGYFAWSFLDNFEWSTGYSSFWHQLCRLQKWTQKAPQTFSSLVQEFPQEIGIMMIDVLYYENGERTISKQ
ncbi:Beta-glucosidase 12 [Morella rubra]|uniref:Beta-glucosidase 12 n=1 Tax=Morella rubra TaxID=262757 RepID=A0A6A1WQR0_9ROSI|nr:Beta-glucosidase 12 [Morella rubra]